MIRLLYLEVQAPKNFTPIRGDVDAPWAAVAIARNGFVTPRAPVGRPHIQSDITDLPILEVVNVPNFGWELLGFDLTPHINPIDRGGENGVDTHRHPVADPCADAGFGNAQVDRGHCRGRRLGLCHGCLLRCRGGVVLGR